MRPNRARLTQTLVDLVRIPSVNPFGAPAAAGRREQEMADELVTRLERLGLETGQRDVAEGRPNVWGRLRGTGGGPTVMLAAHLDTVGVEGCHRPFDPQVADGRVTGRGSCDMKGAIACYLEVVHLLRTHDVRLPGDLIITGLVDEEHVQIGSADLGSNGPHADVGIIGEPTGLRICPAHRGQLGVQIRTFGTATHSSQPERGVNAVEHMGVVMAHLSQLDTELQERGPRHRLCGTGRFSMNVIRGGSVVSSIADYCEMEIDRRFLPGERVDTILADYRARLDELTRQLPGLRVEVSEPTLLVGPLDVPVDSPMVQALSDAHETVVGDSTDVVAFPGATDAAHLGFPCVIFGPGDLEQAHSTTETIEIDQLQHASEIYLRALLDLNGLTPDRPRTAQQAPE